MALDSGIRNSRLAVCNVALHLVNINLPHCLSTVLSILNLSVHVNVHDMFRDHLQGHTRQRV